jgi:antitoxin VapB
METARVFKSGNSQAVRLPNFFRFESKEVEILRLGDDVVLREHKKGLGAVFDALASMSDDFFAEGRDDPPPQEREGL